MTCQILANIGKLLLMPKKRREEIIEGLGKFNAISKEQGFVIFKISLIGCLSI